MDDRTSLNSFGGDQSRCKKFHEGWAHHQPEGSKDWNRFWLVLRGSMIFIFDHDTTHKESMIGTLSLTPETECRNTSSDSKKKGYKFELQTISSTGDRKYNKFKFPTENDRDLWKSFIIGISKGQVPRDVHLLPGQLKDVHEAMGDIHSTPPPLPTITRPTTTIPRPRVNGSGSSEYPSDTFHFGMGDMKSSVRSTGSSGSSGSGSFQSHVVSPKSSRSMSLPGEDAGGVSNLRQLMKRQSDLAFKALDTEPNGGINTEWPDSHMTSSQSREDPHRGWSQSSHTMISPQRKHSVDLPRTSYHTTDRFDHQNSQHNNHRPSYHKPHQRNHMDHQTTPRSHMDQHTTPRGHMDHHTTPRNHMDHQEEFFSLPAEDQSPSVPPSPPPRQHHHHH